MQEKAVSVIIPCYNAEGYLPHCVSSLLKQTIGLENLELIFVDDGSSDGTLEYLYGLEERYPSTVMVVTYPENQGQGVARNIGMSYASGKYIGFVDADDWISPQMYGEMYQKAEETGCELVSSYVYQTKKETDLAPGRFKDEDRDHLYHIQNDAQRRKLLVAGMRVFGTVNVCSKLYRRDFLEKHQLRFGEKYVFEDLYFSDMVAFYVNLFCVMQAEYYCYRIHPGSTMTAMDCVKWSEQRKIMQVWLEECIDRGLFETYYHEIGFIFGRDYYLSILHFVFTRGGENENVIVQKSQRVMHTLFPEIGENPYVLCGGEAYIHNCQKKLFAYVSKGFSPNEIKIAKEDYLKGTLELLYQENTSVRPEITVMLAADKEYLYPAMVLITSLFSQHQEQKVVVYLLYRGYGPLDLEQIQMFAERWGNKEICCIEVPTEGIAPLRAFGRFSVAAFFRILGMMLIPEHVHKILYLDADMLVCRDLSRLFLKEMTKPMAVCYDVNNQLQGNIDYHREALGIPESYPYFNSGMLFMDLDYMRENKVAERLLSDIEEHFEEYVLVDQDALNRYFYKDVEYLPWQEYNCPCVPFLSGSRGDKIGKLLTYPEFRSQGGDIPIYDITEVLMENASIIHFCTVQKPWKDKDFYEQSSMRAGMRIYKEYETLYHKLKT